LIEAENLNKYYGNFQALKAVSFQIEKGETVGFLGPNGAGKTTTMRILTGFLPPSSGKIRVAGFDLLKEPLEVRKRIGYLPESVPLYKEMTVYAFLAFLASIRGVIGKQREARIKEILKRCRLTEYERSPINKLSKGYKQLVGIAQAIVHEPEVLILDEPTIGIDPRQVVHIRELIKAYGRNHTVILSSHILPEVSQVCDRIMVMDRGSIVAVDRPDRLAAGISGAHWYQIEAAGDETRIMERLQRVDGAIKVEVKGSGKEKRYWVESRVGVDIRDALASAIMGGGFRLLGLTTREMSLEDIFLSLTKREED
jgi:ABC-2 type transport system ATP-binding protein